MPPKAAAKVPIRAKRTKTEAQAGIRRNPADGEGITPAGLLPRVPILSIIRRLTVASSLRICRSAAGAISMR